VPLARLRARGQLAELRERDLRFTAEETAVLLGKVMGLELPAGSLAALAARTEGWAAGLQLAGLSLRDHADPAGFVASFSGSQRYILDYLTEEVLARQPEEIVRFLLETSVLERLSGALCDAVTGRSDSQALLEQVERANLFLIPLDDVRGWWRYHQLFADLLRARLQQAQPERVPVLHRAAAAWLEQHGLADDAVRHALAAGDATSAARLVERYVDELWVRGERETLYRWLAVLPAELVGARPRLLLARAGLALLGGDLEAGEGRWMPPSAPSRLRRARPRSRTSRRSAGQPACWGTSPPASRSIAPSLPGSAATPRAPPRSSSGHRPRSVRTSGCWPRSPAGTWRWPGGCGASWPRPRRASSPGASWSRRDATPPRGSGCAGS
jgi:LuxR family transcriptional regulator, maltose regulon positive regulatory protein